MCHRIGTVATQARTVVDEIISTIPDVPAPQKLIASYEKAQVAAHFLGEGDWGELGAFTDRTEVVGSITIVARFVSK